MQHLIAEYGDPSARVFGVPALLAIGITARILKDMKRMGMRESRIVPDAAVLDDVPGHIALLMAPAWLADKIGLAAVIISNN